MTDDAVGGAPAEGSETVGLTSARVVGLERVPIRTRGSAVTQSAWRLGVESAEGSGHIAWIEASPSEIFFRGDGIFLGWEQGRLAAAYAALVPKDDVPPLQTLQLG
jgi:hypothetical protein